MSENYSQRKLTSQPNKQKVKKQKLYFDCVLLRRTVRKRKCTFTVDFFVLEMVLSPITYRIAVRLELSIGQAAWLLGHHSTGLLVEVD